MDPKSSRVGPRRQGGQSQSTFGSVVGAITSPENRSVVTALGLFAAGVAFLHSNFAPDVLLPP